MSVKAIFIYIILLLFPMAVLAGPSKVAIIESLDQPFDLSPYIEYLEDPDFSITYDDIQSGEFEDRWVTNTAPIFVASNFNSRYWFRIKLNFLKDFSTLDPRLCLNTHSSLLYKLSFWMPDGEGGVRESKTGLLYPYSERESKNIRLGLKIPVQPLNYTLLGMVENKDIGMSAFLPMSIMSASDYVEDNHLTQIMMIAFYSMMLALLIYNACLYVSIRQPLYGAYLLFLISTMVTCAFLDSSTIHWLWPEEPRLNFRLNNINSILVSVFYLIFVWLALDSLKFSKGIRRGTQVMFLLGGLSLIHNSISSNLNHLSIVSQTYSGLSLPCVLITMIVAVKKKLPSAEYLLLAEAFAIVGSVSFILTAQGVLTVNSLTLWALHGGFLCEALLLSLCLASRTNIAIEEKLFAQTEALKHQRKAKDAAEESIRVKNEFLTTISHELRTPLNSIIGFSEAIGEENDPAIISSYNDTVLQSGQQLLNIIDNILNLSIIEKHDIKMNVEWVDINLFLNKLKGRYEEQASQKGLLFLLSAPKSLPTWIEIDQLHLANILHHLCDNAVKFTDTGNVSVTVEFNEKPDQENAGEIQFCVMDTGIGIDKDKERQIFEVFTQGDGSDSRRYKGTGLGLYIVKSLVEKLGGIIKVESTADIGSKFTLQLPVGSRKAIPSAVVDGVDESADTPLISSGDQSQLKGHVLYVEDNIDNQNLIRIIVQKTGAEIVLAENGEKAIELIARRQSEGLTPFDIILMDLQMPVMDGYEATRILREQGHEMPIIAFSASALAQIEENKNVTFDGYLSKPVVKKKLLEVLHLYLDTVEGEVSENENKPGEF